MLNGELCQIMSFKVYQFYQVGKTMFLSYETIGFFFLNDTLQKDFWVVSIYDFKIVDEVCYSLKAASYEIYTSLV